MKTPKKVYDPQIRRVLGIIEQHYSALYQEYREKDYDAECYFLKVKDGLDYATHIIIEELGEDIDTETKSWRPC